jgi:hypothetical protein
MKNSILDFTSEQFDEVAKAFSDRVTAGDKMMEATFAALAGTEAFNRRFLSAAMNAGLDPSNPVVQQHVRAIAMTFFLYGEALGRVEAPSVVN